MSNRHILSRLAGQESLCKVPYPGSWVTLNVFANNDVMREHTCPTCVNFFDELYAQSLFSFTTTVRSWLDDEEEVVTMMRLQRTRFFFDCMEDHVFDLDGNIPVEVSWGNTVEDIPHSRTEVEPKYIQPEVLSKFAEFKQLLFKANLEGRVYWRGE